MKEAKQTEKDRRKKSWKREQHEVDDTGSCQKAKKRKERKNMGLFVTLERSEHASHPRDSREPSTAKRQGKDEEEPG